MFLDLKTISKFAQLEYKMGDPERGKTIFEGIIESHPKRWDIWSIYVDMEATLRNIQSIRFVDSNDSLPVFRSQSTIGASSIAYSSIK